MKKGIVLVAMVALWGCKDTPKAEPIAQPEKIEHVALEEEVTPSTTKKEILPREEKIGMDVLLPMFYDKDFYGEEVAKINSKWLALFESNGQFQVRKAKYELQVEMNECTESEVIGAISTEEEGPILFFSDTKDILKGKKETLTIKEVPLWPEAPQEYVFKGKTYVLRAEGKQMDSYLYTDDSEQEKTFKLFQDYKLYLSIDGGEEQLVLDIPHFNDTFVQLLFVGDLDNDGLLDFVFDTSAEYEQKSVELYLSKGAKHYLYLAGTTTVDFAC
ncbi:hypothetical protein [Myroides sp. WP-1]|uniref:hypothetical protein n=1 Tax=Myroides sp. WP-1 TaxID=2759944 RepID=UPI0015F9EDF1|nr:hypothetical protein [Myroides sp. WP-1]MBB1138814.1 hypothetical protein [Myroides sp. WP-1]